MGIERSQRQAFVRVDPIRVPWVVYPREITSLSGIIERLDALASIAHADEAERKFWQTLRDNVIGTAQRIDRAMSPFTPTVFTKATENVAFKVEA